MTDRQTGMSRRRFVQGTAVAAAAVTMVPRHVLGGAGRAAPSETINVGLIGCGSQAGEDVNSYIRHEKGKFRMVACCDVDAKRLDTAVKRRWPGSKPYADFRRLLERDDIDVVSVATPPHWHALLTIAAMEAGKDVLCEKPMTKFIAEGRAVVNAAKRYGRVFQIGTSGRFGACRSTRSKQIHNIMRSGLLKKCPAVWIKRGGFPVKRYCGKVNEPPRPVPGHLDWDMYCGPANLSEYFPDKFGWNHRFYWDYEGASLADFAQHYLDPIQWIYAKDDTSPVSIEAYAPPSHPDAAGVWSWAEMTYADGLTFVLDGNEWGPGYNRKQARHVAMTDLDEASRKKVAAMAEPEPLLSFPEAVRTRKRAGGHAEAAHRAATVLHLANIAIRTGRKLKYDPVAEQIVGDELANRLVNQPMRAPWHL